MMRLFKFVIKADANHAFEYVVMAESVANAFRDLRAYYKSKYEKELYLHEVHYLDEVNGNISETFC